MNLRKITLIISILYLLGGSIELYKHIQGASIFLFEDYPIAIAIFILNGFMYLGGFLSYSNYKIAKPLLITAGILSLCTGGVMGFYDAYVGFGNSYEAFPFVAPVFLIFLAIVVWYIKAVQNMNKRPYNNGMQSDAAEPRR